MHQNLRFEKQVVFLVNRLIQVHRFVFLFSFLGLSCQFHAFHALSGVLVGTRIISVTAAILNS